MNKACLCYGHGAAEIAQYRKSGTGNNRPHGAGGKEVLITGHASGGVSLLHGEFLWLCAQAALP